MSGETELFKVKDVLCMRILPNFKNVISTVLVLSAVSIGRKGQNDSIY